MLPTIKRYLMPINFAAALELMAREYRHSSTAKWFNTPIKQFIEFNNLTYDTSITAVTAEHCTLWGQWVHNQPLSDETKDSYIRALNTFFAKLVKLKHLGHNPAAHLERPRLTPKPPKDIEEDRLDLLVKYSQYDLRTHALILILRDTGARIGGILSMNISTTFFEEKDGQWRGRSLVHEKGDHQRGKQQRMVFFKHEAAIALKQYLELRPVCWDDVDAVWLSNRGQRLSLQGTYHSLRRVAQKAGIEKGFNPHAFRHRKAKELMNNKAPQRVIQDIMGWSSPRMLDRYVKYRDNELAEFYEQYTD